MVRLFPDKFVNSVVMNHDVVIENSINASIFLVIITIIIIITISPSQHRRRRRRRRRRRHHHHHMSPFIHPCTHDSPPLIEATMALLPCQSFCDVREHRVNSNSAR